MIAIGEGVRLKELLAILGLGDSGIRYKGRGRSVIDRVRRLHVVRAFRIEGAVYSY